MNKINVIGTSGSGKSTFAKHLAKKLNYLLIEMDEIFWEKDWKHLNDEDFKSQLKIRLDSNENWVLDGNFSRTTEVKWKEVDTIIWIDYSFPRTLFQAIRRAFQRIYSQKELWPDTGNKESLTRLFSKESIVLWTIQTYHQKKKRYSELFIDTEYKHVNIIRLQSPKECKTYLSQL